MTSSIAPERAGLRKRQVLQLERSPECPNLRPRSGSSWSQAIVVLFAEGEQHFHDIERSLLDVELDQAGARFQIAQVSQQITQAKGGMNVFCVQCGQDDVGHKVGGIYHAPLPSSKRNKARITGETNNFFVLITWE